MTNAHRPDLRVRLDAATARVRSAITNDAPTDDATRELCDVLRDTAEAVATIHAAVAHGPMRGHVVTRGRMAAELGCSVEHIRTVVILARWSPPWPDARQRTGDRRPGETRAGASARRARERRRGDTAPRPRGRPRKCT